MGRLLAALIADSGTAPAANPAKVANLTPAPAERFADSQDSQGVRPASAEPDTGAIRIRLLELATATYMDTAPVRALSESFLRDCDGMADDALRALLAMLADDADRRVGRVPKGDTAAALCHHCGPVWLHPSIVAVLPVVNGWPRALGCPWCFIRAAGGYIPRPLVAAADCTHWKPDTVNPSGGRGKCQCGHWWPTELHGCKDFQPKENL